MKRMRQKISAVSLTIATCTSVTSFAESSNCLRAYQESSTAYAKTIANLKNDAQATFTGSILSGLAVGICAIATRTPACLGLAAPGGVALGYRSQIQDQIQELEDAHRIYQTYLRLLAGETQGPEAQAFYTDVRVPSVFESRMNTSFLDMVESGQLCRNNKPATSWQALTLSLRDSIYIR